ncbi:hypothetical protein [Sphingobacterium deserti]|uniref:Uncharacterized protein n=1 Tax=Sphingobacterium deserti TaxID=1229276 RepID=A0A0B8T784_9SPHI|nr:hypothetical protein [Sphingobacterium deserti]KGE14234.1 hypothetical protein DI53_2064 [Sphingobacterium deserti]
MNFEKFFLAQKKARVGSKRTWAKESSQIPLLLINEFDPGVGGL